MQIRYFGDAEASLRHLQSLIDTRISELLAVGWRRTRSGYTVDHQSIGPTLELNDTGTPSTDPEPPKTVADDPTAGRGPGEAPPGGLDNSATPEWTGREPHSPGTPTRPPDGPPPPLPLAYLDETPVSLQILLRSQDFRQDVIVALVTHDPTGHLDRDITLDVRKLDDTQWDTLVRAGRQKDPIEVTVYLIIGRAGRPMSRRVRVVAVTGAPPPAQGSLFA